MPCDALSNACSRLVMPAVFWASAWPLAHEPQGVIAGTGGKAPEESLILCKQVSHLGRFANDEQGHHGAESDKLRIWNVAKKTELLPPLCENNRNLDAIAWSSDSTHIAIGGYLTGEIYNIHTRNLISTFKLESNGDDFIPTINSISWSPDGKYIAIACSDSNGHQDRKTNAVRVWDIANQQWAYTYYNHVGLGDVERVSWSPDGTRIASVSFDLDRESHSYTATIHIWIAPR